MKEEGILIISTPNKEVYSDKYNYQNEYHIKEFYYTEFDEFLKSHFSNVNFFIQKDEVFNVIEPGVVSEYVGNHMHNYESAKYYICICANKDFDTNQIKGTMSERSDLLEKTVNRILDLQDEVENLSEWGNGLGEENRRNRELLEARENYIQKLSGWGSKLEEENKRNSVLLEKREGYIQELSQWGEKLEDENRQNKALLEEREVRIQKLSEWGRNLEAENERKRILLDERESQIQKLAQWGKELDKEIEQDRVLLEKRELRIQELSTWGKMLDERVTNMEGIKKEMEYKNKELSTQNQILSAEFENLHAKIDDLMQLQTVISEKSEVIKDFDIHIHDLKKVIAEQKEEINHLSADNEEQRNNFSQEIQSYKNEVKCLKGHVELLLESDRELEHIKNSNGFKF